MKWKLIISTCKQKGYVACWTYRPDIGYIFEGLELSLKSALDYYGKYLRLINSECYPNGRKLISYKIVKNLKEKILRIV